MKLFGLEIRRTGNDTSTLPGRADTGSNHNYFSFSPYMSTTEMLSNTTVAACVNIIADAVAILPIDVYKKTADGRIRDDALALSKCLRKHPNYDDTPYTFKQQIMLHLLLKGNAFIFIDRNADFSVRALTPLDPERVTICRDSAGDVYYEYEVNGKAYKYNNERILHIPAIKLNNLRGLSPMEYATHAAKLGLTLDQYTNDSFTGGIHSKLLVEVPVEEKNWNESDSKKLNERLASSYAGRENQNKALIISKGLKAQPITIDNNSDSKLVENRVFSEKEIAKIYRVPLFMLGKDDAKFTNTEQLNTFFLQQTLTPWIVRLQEYLDRLLPTFMKDSHYIEFNTDSLLRADYRTRTEMYIQKLNNGILTLNQVLAKENLPTVDEPYADKHFTMVNMSTMDKVAENKVAEE